MFRHRRLWEVRQCSLSKYNLCFEVDWHFRLQGASEVSNKHEAASSLTMEATCCSEASPVPADNPSCRWYTDTGTLLAWRDGLVEHNLERMQWNKMAVAHFRHQTDSCLEQSTFTAKHTGYHLYLTLVNLLTPSPLEHWHQHYDVTAAL
jgi:hypothetical protein